jgi:hypothetical protein
MLTRLPLFKQLPHVRWRPTVAEPLLPREEQAKYPALAEDFACLEREVLPHFQELNNKALRAPNHFRLEQVTLIAGGACATILGAMLAVFPDWRMVGVVEALLTAGVGAVAWRGRALKPEEHYFTLRLKAETLRREYFLFLGRLGPYASDPDRVPHLIRRVADIKREGT